MKNLKTTIVTAVIALSCYVNVNAQAAEGKIKGKVVTSGDNGTIVAGPGSVRSSEDKNNTPNPDEQQSQQANKGGKTGWLLGKSDTIDPNSAKTPPPVQDWKNKRNIHQYPGGGHAVTENKTTESDEPQPQQTARGIKDPAVKGCGHCPITGKVKAGGNPQATEKDTDGATEGGTKDIPGVPRSHGHNGSSK